MRLGVIADTHGWLDPEVALLFADVDAILHAGDIGGRPCRGSGSAVLAELAAIAPVHAVRGNVDICPEVAALPERLDLLLAGVWLHLVHRPVDAQPGEAGVVVTGHTHRPLVEWYEGVLRLNPGAAGRRGFHTERTLALLNLGVTPWRADVISLGPRGARPLVADRLR